MHWLVFHSFLGFVSKLPDFDWKLFLVERKRKRGMKSEKRRKGELTQTYVYPSSHRNMVVPEASKLSLLFPLFFHMSEGFWGQIQ